MRAKLLARTSAGTRRTRWRPRRCALAERTDFLTIHADALIDLAEVLRQGGREDEADASLARALELFERKGDVASLARAARESRLVRSLSLVC